MLLLKGADRVFPKDNIRISHGGVWLLPAIILPIIRGEDKIVDQWTM